MTVTPPFTVVRSICRASAGAGQLDVNSAVDRPAADLAGHALQITPPFTLERETAVDVGNIDAAIVGLEGEFGGLRHEDLVAHAPPRVPLRLRSAGAHLSARAVDHHPAGEDGRGAFGLGLGLDASAHQHIAALPAFTVTPPI